MTTPRQLSDAVKADYERLAAEHAQKHPGAEKWQTARNVSKWIAFISLVVIVTSILFAATTATFGGFLLLVLVFPLVPLVLIPAFIVWVVAMVTIDSHRRRTDEAMFTEYGITVDRSIEPPVYSVTIPYAWLPMKLVYTRKILAPDNA